MRTLLGHELGHVMSGHALLLTILILILKLQFLDLTVPGGHCPAAPSGSRCSNGSGRASSRPIRAGLLAVQDPQAAMRMHLKMAGGGDMKQMNLDEFLVQPRTTRNRGRRSTESPDPQHARAHASVQHAARRRAERWIGAGQYERILNGEYTRRGPDADNRRSTRTSMRRASTI